VVPLLGPGIREEDEDRREPGALREDIEEQGRLGPHEMKRVELGAIALAKATFNTVEDDVDADTDALRVLLIVTRQKMPMAAADFPDDLPFNARDRHEHSPRLVSALLHIVEVALGNGVIPPRPALTGVLRVFLLVYAFLHPFQS